MSPDQVSASATGEELRHLADILDDLPEGAWDDASLCEGWRVREVVAHLTMPVRYTAEAFRAELQACGGDFTRLSDTIAARDAHLAPSELVAGLRSEVMASWEPPGGGTIGALSHAVIHGLDVTIPIGRRRSPDARLLAVLELLAAGVAQQSFGVDLGDVRIEATDVDWSFGSGRTVRGRAEDLVALLAGRTAPADRVTGWTAEGTATSDTA